jgi:hypothetical protein
MPNYNPTQIANLAGQLGGDPQRAAQQLQQVGGQIDPEQHADTLRGMGIDPRKLQNGDYQQHLDAQKQPGFQSARGGDASGQMGQGGMGQDSRSGMGQRGQSGKGQDAQSGMGQNRQSGMSQNRQGGMSQNRQGGMSQGGRGGQSGQNFQQFDQDQGGMRGMEPDPNQQLSDDRQMAGRQADQMAGQRGGRQGRQQSGRQSGRPSRRQSEQQDDSDQQDQ